MNPDSHNNRSIITNEDIEVISSLLLTLETVLFNVGIPIIPDGKDRRALKQAYFSPYEEYIKCSLVTVPTSHLLQYIENLDFRSQDEKTQDIIKKSLVIKNIFEIIFFPLIVMGLTFSIVFPISLPYSASIMNAMLSATFSTLGALAGAILSTTDSYRYYTFKHILNNEISRREGKIGFLPTRKIPLTTMQMSETRTEKTLC